MRIVFMGTAEFAEKSLSALYEAGRDVVGVFTKPDRPKGRGMKLVPDIVKTLAESKGTPVYQPETLRDGTAYEALKALSPDLIVVVSYGKILPKDILDLPPLGCINIHGSLLPKYRGSAPVQWSVINGDEIAGVTSMYMAEGMDTGDIIAYKSTPIGEHETSGMLYSRLAEVGASLLTETVDAIECGDAVRTPQNEEDATYAPPLTKDMSPIDWTRPSRAVISQIHGLDPWPAATANLAGTDFKIFGAERMEASAAAPGDIIFADKRGIAVACGDGAVLITELQAAGGKRMRADDYLRGHPICL